MTQWYIDRLKEALEGQGDHMLLKACQHTVDGVDDNQTRQVGFSGCESIKRADAIYNQHTEDETKASTQPAKEETYSNSSTTTTSKKEREARPGTLNVDGWLALSEGLKTERMRVLEGLDNLRQVGSMMLERSCDETDKCRGGPLECRHIYVHQLVSATLKPDEAASLMMIHVSCHVPRVAVGLYVCWFGWTPR